MQRLRKEMKVLNNPEEDIADISDIQGAFEGNDDDEDHTLDETQRSVQLMLRSKVIETNNYGEIFNTFFRRGYS